MFIEQKRLFQHFNYTTFLLTFFISVIGLACIYSATITPSIIYSIFFKKQLFGILTGVIIYLCCAMIDYRNCLKWGFLGYFIVLGLLIFTLVKGHVGMGAQRWIDFGIVKVQPSELVKLFLPLFTTFYFHNYIESEQQRFSSWIPFIIILTINFILVLKQPDLGTALVILFSGLSMAWAAAMNTRFFTISALIMTCTWPFIWHNVLKEYQKKRIVVFLGGGSAHNERYQIEQAKIAIGSGGIYGKGFTKGTQNKLRFLPEGRTDFIFAVLAEEFGFVGCMLILLCYALLFFIILFTAHSMAHTAQYICILGLIIPIMLAGIINIAMVLGLLPVVGMPLPLMSYGVSNLWITFASLGIIQAITMQTKKGM